MSDLINNSITFLPTLLFGMALGCTFFLILWFTVRKGVTSPHPAKWFIGGLVIRMAIALSGFYLLSSSGWLNLVVCLLGFIIAREWVRKLLVNGSLPGSNLPDQEQHNAP